MLDHTAYPYGRRKVYDFIAVIYNGSQAVMFSDGCNLQGKFWIILMGGQVFTAASWKVINHGDLGILSQQRIYQMRTYKTGATGYQIMHVVQGLSGLGI